MIIAGIDEAGYGPLLGPLVVSAVAFSTPEALDPADTSLAGSLARKLSRAVTTRPPVRGGKLIIADSKIVHRLSHGLAHMERAVLSMVRLLPQFPTPAALPDSGGDPVLKRTALLRLCGSPSPGIDALHWYAHDQRPLPRFCDPGSIDIAVNMFRGALTGASVNPAGVWTRVIDEVEFNRLAGATGNKGAVLVSITLAHLSRLHEQFGASGLLAVIDKQGARDHYVPLLLRTFPGAALKVLRESSEQSLYFIQDGPRQSLVVFREKAESTCLATALASMLCKYLRELFMDSFNSWWGLQIPDLAPTAGYYQDAQRWLGQAGGHFQRLGVRPENLIRAR
jgi:hypothetical protein